MQIKRAASTLVELLVVVTVEFCNHVPDFGCRISFSHFAKVFFGMISIPCAKYLDPAEWFMLFRFHVC